MEAQRKRKLTRRNPLSDCTNTSSSSVSLNPIKTNPSFSSSAPKKPTTRFTSATNLEHVSNPSSPLPSLLSTHSPQNGIFSVEASEPFSAVHGRRIFSNIRKEKGKEVAIPVSSTPILNERKDKGKEVTIPESSTPILSKNNDKGKEVTIPVSSTPILNKREYKGKEVAIPESSAPILNKREDKGKEVAIPESSAPILSKRNDKGKEVAISVSSAPILNKRKDKGKKVAIPDSSAPILNKREDKGKEVTILVSSTPILGKRNDKGTFYLEASEPISAVFSRRSFSNIRKDKEKELATPESSTPILSKRDDNGKEVAIPVSNTPISKFPYNREKNDGVEGANLPKTKAATDPCRKKRCAVSSERDVFRDPASNKRKDRGKEVAIPVSSTPILEVSDTRERNYEVEGENLPKAKALTVPCRKKQRAMFDDPLLQDYIEKQKAYFKMIDEFELPVEEV